MQDQGMIGGPALEREDAAHCLWARPVGGQAIDRLGREPDDFAATKRRDRLIDVLFTERHGLL
jgi:hypothetical protein